MGFYGLDWQKVAHNCDMFLSGLLCISSICFPINPAYTPRAEKKTFPQHDTANTVSTCSECVEGEVPK